VKRITRRGLARRLLGFGRGVYIVGMHRSGTSAVTRTVNLMGIPLSDPTDHIAALESFNPTGHWESSALLKLNDRVLQGLGGAWSAPPILPAGWERQSALALLRREAKRQFGETYRTRQWVWKDPRICLTLPFWRSSIPARAVAVLVVRHPLEIANSLQARDGFPLQYGLALWERYMRHALVGAAGLPVLVTAYDDLLSDAVGWCSRVARFLSRNGFQVTQLSPDELASFVDPKLRHSELTIESLAVEGATASQRALYETLRGLAGSHEPLRPVKLPLEAPGTEALIAAHRASVMRTGDQWLIPAV
jgi:hypothetical protein